MRIHPEFDWINLTPEPGHFLFGGYYDRCAWDPATKRHLALKIPQQDHLPEPGETAEVGYVEPGAKEFVRLATTEAWCHQVGALLTWLPGRDGVFVYDDFEQRGATWAPVTRLHHVTDGPCGQWEGHIYNLSPDGRWASVLDFARLPRRGYSFARAPLPAERKMPDLDKEGLRILDTKTGKSRMLVTYRQVIEAHPRAYGFEDWYVWINQGNFNCDSTRVMFLFRSCAEAHQPSPWQTDLFTVNLDGSGLLCCLPEPYWNRAVSHQIWGRTPREVLVDANWCKRGHQYVVFQEDRRPIRGERLSDGQTHQGHLNFSPDGKWIAGDTYPVEGFQSLVLAEVGTARVVPVGRFAHPKVENVDLRCDLHPRWSPDGRYVTVDSVHEGERKIFMLDAKDALKRL